MRVLIWGIASVLLTPVAVEAQARTIPIRRVTVPVNSSEPFAMPPSVRGLPSGRLLVNDQRGKRLLIFDSTLASITVVADSVRSTGLPYPSTFFINPLMRYIGDSTLLMDFEAKTYLVIDPTGKVARAMAPVNTRDLGVGSRPFPGTPASDNLGRLIFRGTETRPSPKPGDPPVTATRDTISIVRADFNERRTDTIGFFSVPRFANTVYTRLPNGKTAGSRVINAGFSGPDEWAVLSDGTLAIVREHDYVVDWIGSDGTTSSSGKLPFEWIRQTDAMKQARVDSMKRIIDSVNASGPGYGMEIRFVRTPDGGPTRTDTIIPTITFAPLSEMADYPSPMRRGSAKPDEDGNLWVLPTASSLARGGLLYDVINKQSGLHERVQLPADYDLAGFGKGGVVYLVKADASRKTWTLGKTRVLR
ncbi:MAG: hypothetical protein IT353_23990 [Gemmatimonadaceae bacterium]|nr:hypothetical protein [Gemmatimonadaceae bacterium]